MTSDYGSSGLFVLSSFSSLLFAWIGPSAIFSLSSKMDRDYMAVDL